MPNSPSESDRPRRVRVQHRGPLLIEGPVEVELEDGSTVVSDRFRVALCTREYDPVVVTVDGVWRGKRVSYERTFANECVKSSYGTSVFAF